MVFKPAPLFLITQLLLCLASIEVNAEESILLIDNTRDIDNTRAPASQHIENLKQSLQNILSDEESEQEVTIDQNNIGDEESTLLIDSTQGIDNTRDPALQEIEDLKQSLQNILSEEESEQEITIDHNSIGTEESELLNDTHQAIDNSSPINAKSTLPVDEISKTTLPDKTIDKTTPKELISPATIDTTVIDSPLEESSSEITLQDKNNGTWIPQDSDLRILEIRVESYKLDDVIAAYQYKDIVLVPLGALSSLIDIAIDIKENSAQGFIIKEDNTFFLDTSRNEVIIRGKPETYRSDLVKNLDNDIYVESNLLSEWFNMKLDVDLFSSRIVVTSELKLPFLARIDREKRIAQIQSRIKKSEQQYPRHHEPYNDYDLPFIDETLRLAQRISDEGNVTTFNSTTYATADLLQHESTWYLTLDDQKGVNDFRVTFGRTDPDGELLGPINAKDYKFGHVSEQRVGLVNSPSSLRYGATVSSFPIGLQTEYDRHRFIGDLLPGWEVELYQNNALIGYQQIPIDGQYDFQDIPLLFGNNHFRLVFYGPKGELREETKNFQLSHALTKQGEHFYRGSTITDDNGDQRTVAQIDYGISKNISGKFNLVSIPLKELTTSIQHNYVGAGLIGYWDSLLASASFISDSASGNAVEIDLQTRIDETIIGFNDIYLSDFFSEEFRSSSSGVIRRSILDINTAIPPTLLPRIPVSFGFKRDEYANSTELLTITNQISLSAYGVAITNQLNHQQLTDQQSTGSGNLQISTNIDNIRLRGSIGYTLKPIKELSNLALTLDPGQFDEYRLSFGINRSLQQNSTEFSATASKISGKYGLSFGARYNNNGDINLDVNFSLGFGYEPRRKNWQQDASNLANQGSVSARFFLDTNQDGIFGDGDTPIEDVGVRLNQGYKKERSDKDGILFLTGIPAHNPTNVIVASGTMADPLWTSALDGIRVVPRPGHAIMLDFPIFSTGEVDGMVELAKGDRYIGVGDVTVELVDQNDHVISTTETAYDGFYILSHIPMGEFKIRISKTQLDKLGLLSPKEDAININSDKPFINGVDFILRSNKNN